MMHLDVIAGDDEYSIKIYRAYQNLSWFKTNPLKCDNR